VTVRLPDDIDVGAATHTGQVRSTNEDDYLVLVRSGSNGDDRLFAVADGMGGVSGGAEASRAAVRSFASAFLASPTQAPRDRVEAGFAAAAREVFRLSRESPQLADMGTTLTVVHLVEGTAVIGHVGDSRCLLLREGRLRRLTRDHAVEEPRHLLTRCIGAGREVEEVDVDEVRLAAGDVVALISDGIWAVLDDDALQRALRLGSAQRAADQLVRLANRAGGPDNATAVVVRVVPPARPRPSKSREVELPAEETRLPLEAPELRIEPPRWPWLVLALASVPMGIAVARLWFGVDLLSGWF
jgi:protein phosphatase